MKKHIYSASVNINRDNESILNYVATTNSSEVFRQIYFNFHTTKQHAFTIVGAYGTGKSAFLWALEKTLKNEANYFNKPLDIDKVNQFEFIKLIGEHASVMQTLSNFLGLDNYTAVSLLNALSTYYSKLKLQGKGLVIVFDEFGKFLEYSAKNNPESELYFIQQLAEWVCDETKNVMLIATLHQGFSAYSYALTSTQRSEWRKVEGRFKELTFNEPVEQLLKLASEYINWEEKPPKNINEVFDCIKSAHKRLIKDNYSLKFAKSVYPFDILTASVLTTALQRYGQNERSLFSFLNSDDYHGLLEFKKTDEPYFNLCRLYDYLVHNFNSFIKSKDNPDFFHWVSVKNCIEKAEENSILSDLIVDVVNVVKVIGLLNIFSSAGAVIDSDFIIKYLSGTSKGRDVSSAINLLLTLKLIKFTKHSQRFSLFEGTDIDIDKEINKAKLENDINFDIVKELQEYFEFPYISAKKTLLQKGTPRIFGFQISESPLTSLEAENELDGYINLIFSSKIKENEVLQKSAECNEAVLFGYFSITEKIRETILEIKAIKKVRISNSDDKIAVRELLELENYQASLLNQLVMENLETKNENICWFFKGKRIEIFSIREFNRVLSDICDIIYPHTPVYWNEMINTSELSGAMVLARKNLFKKLLENSHIENIGFDSNVFSPEKTIYLSLLQSTGIHRQSENGFMLSSPENPTFHALWKLGDDFLQEAKSVKRNLSDFFNILYKKPIKLKKGFLDFWVPLFLIIKKNDFALFENGIYKPEITPDDIDVILKLPDTFEIKTFDVEGVKLDVFNSYRTIINKAATHESTNKTFIETIKPFLVFYKGLDDYTKKTSRLQKTTLKLREAIANAKEPEKSFFEDFPAALGYSLVSLQNNTEELENFAKDLQSSIRELRVCFDNLLSRFEAVISETVGSDEFTEYKNILKNRFKKLKKYALLPHQVVFLQRVNSSIDDRKSWLISIADACIGKSISAFGDDDEFRLYEHFREIVFELDNLNEIIEKDFDAEKEDVFQIQLTTFVEGLKKRMIRLPKKRSMQMIDTEKKLKNILELEADKSIRLAILADLLKEELKNG